MTHRDGMPRERTREQPVECEALGCGATYGLGGSTEEERLMLLGPGVRARLTAMRQGEPLPPLPEEERTEFVDLTADYKRLRQREASRKYYRANKEKIQARRAKNRTATFEQDPSSNRE